MSYLSRGRSGRRHRLSLLGGRHISPWPCAADPVQRYSRWTAPPARARRPFSRTRGPRGDLRRGLIIASVAFRLGGPRTRTVERSAGLVVAGVLTAVTVAPYVFVPAPPPVPGCSCSSPAPRRRRHGRPSSPRCRRGQRREPSSRDRLGGLVAAVVIVGVISESSALQRFAATRVAPLCS